MKYDTTVNLDLKLVDERGFTRPVREVYVVRSDIGKPEKAAKAAINRVFKGNVRKHLVVNMTSVGHWAAKDSVTPDYDISEVVNIVEEAPLEEEDNVKKPTRRKTT